MGPASEDAGDVRASPDGGTVEPELQWGRRSEGRRRSQHPWRCRPSARFNGAGVRGRRRCPLSASGPASPAPRFNRAGVRGRRESLARGRLGDAVDLLASMGPASEDAGDRLVGARKTRVIRPLQWGRRPRTPEICSATCWQARRPCFNGAGVRGRRGDLTAVAKALLKNNASMGRRGTPEGDPFSGRASAAASMLQWGRRPRTPEMAIRTVTSCVARSSFNRGRRPRTPEMRLRRRGPGGGRGFNGAGVRGRRR